MQLIDHPSILSRNVSRNEGYAGFVTFLDYLYFHLRAIGIDAVLGVVPPAKMLTVAQLRIDTGDSSLDAEFQEKKYLKVLQGYRTTRLLKVAED